MPRRTLPDWDTIERTLHKRMHRPVSWGVLGSSAVSVQNELDPAAAAVQGVAGEAHDVERVITAVASSGQGQRR
ncbi:hypothetical protein Slu03_13330 [Sediminihabitans luteus]|nr:hypothetical protein Slu03_13330 [Sediminihabitans luteus]